jgi:hypothetical protein
METKHTPRPWFLSHASGDTMPITAEGYTVAEALPFDNEGEQEANARLIAAAPELLDALEGVEEWMREYSLDYEIDHDSREQKLMLKISSAIAKAKGN